MFNFIYLNHNFEKLQETFIFQCKKCKIIIWNSGMFDDKIYWMLDEDLFHIGEKLSLTCEEQIIKSIIE